MFFEKRKKGIITVFALLLAAFIAGGVFSVSAKYIRKLSEESTYVQVSLTLDPNYAGAAASEWRNVSPESGHPMPAVTPPARTGFYFTGYYSEDGSAGHEQNDGNRYYKNDGTSYKNWDASRNVLYAGWAEVHTVTFRNMTGAEGSVVATYYELAGVLYTDAALSIPATEMPKASNGGRTDLSYWTTEKTGKTGAGGAAPVVVSGGAVQPGTYTDDQGHGFTVNDMSHWTLESDITLYAVWYTVNYYKDSRSLPDGYTELQYTASTGSQYIDTGVIPGNYKNNRLEIDFALKFSQINSGDYVYRAGINTNLLNCFSMYIPSNSAVEWIVGGFASDQLGRHSVSTNLLYRYDVVYQSSKLYVNGENKGNTSGNFGNNRTLLFYTGHTDSDFSNERLYYLRISGNNVLQRDYVPARRDSDGRIGLYDKKNNSFNAGSGTFVTEYYSQVFAYGEVGNLQPVVTAAPADGLPEEQAAGSYDCGYTNRAGNAPEGWTLTKHGSTSDYDIGGVNNRGGNQLWNHISGGAGSLTVNLYTVLSEPVQAPSRLTSMFHSGDKSTEYVYVEPFTGEYGEENINE